MKTSFVLLGGTSDLARRLLLPGLGEYVRASRADVEVLGAGRDKVDGYQDQVREAGADVAARYFAVDATSSEDVQKLLDATSGDRTVMYMALAPAVAVKVVNALRDVRLPEEIVIAIEKPYGSSADEADALDEALRAVVSEEQIYRVDHFLSEPAVNRAALEVSANGGLERIEFVYEESLALEGRAEFYDSTGAARDMVQSHMLQSVARILAGSASPEASLEALESLKVRPDSVRRARYEGYTEEDGVDPANDTETLVQLELDAVSGVSVLLRTGKAFAKDRKFLRLAFAGGVERELELYDGPLSPYGTVIRGLFEGDRSVSVPAGGAQAGWRAMQPVLEAMADTAMEEYAQGSTGPGGWE